MSAAADKRREERELGIAFMEKHRQQMAAEALVRLRDEFAGLAMQGWIASTPADGTHLILSDTADHVAHLSYEMADAMLRARGAA